MSAFLERVRAALASKGYEVLRELGSGGMGIVVLARQPRRRSRSSPRWTCCGTARV